MDKEPPRQVTIRLTQEMWADIERLSQKRAIRPAITVRMLVKERLDQLRSEEDQRVREH